MVSIPDKDKELLEAEIKKILTRHQTWVKENYKKTNIWEVLKESTRVYDRILNLALPVFGIGLSEQICLVGLGSYGREEICPHSDMDLLVLYQGLGERRIEEFSGRLLGLLWDLKIKVSHSLRTVEECLETGGKDNSVLSSLIDARAVAGNVELFNKLQAGLEKLINLQGREFFKAKLEELNARRRRFGEVIWRLERNLMEGAGGLRDWHLTRWLSMVGFGVKDGEGLARLGLLNKSELIVLKDVIGRLFRLRVALHLLSEEKNDYLRLDLQEALAKELEIEGKSYSEKLDALYFWAFKGSELVVEVLERVITDLKMRYEGRRYEPIPNYSFLAKSEEGIEIIYPWFQNVIVQGKDKGFELFRCQAEAGLNLSPVARAILAKNFSQLKTGLRKGLIELFKLSNKPSVVIKELKRIGELNWVFPELESTFYIGQRDGYHFYTVGFHSIRCLERIEAFEKEPEFGDDPEIDWRILKLAGLIHDLGKAKAEEHTKAGVEIVARVSARLGLSPIETGLLKFLVREHLLLNHYAQKRDFYEPKAVKFLVKKIKDASRLKLLYLLTVADIQAVSDKSWTSWKADLLHRLYHFLLAYLVEKESLSLQMRRRLKELKKRLKKAGLKEERFKELSKLPARYLLGSEPELIVEQMEMIEKKAPGALLIKFKILEKPRLEITIIYEDYPGLFSELSGVFSALNYNILSAEINTINRTALDIFVVEDLVAERSEFWEKELEQRRELLGQTLEKVVKKEISAVELMARKRGIFRPKARVEVLPEVHLDQESSDKFTIIEVQAQDQLGLLYKITRVISEQGLDIHLAKISTRANKVFDTFYLRDPETGGKVNSEKISRLLTALSGVLEGGCKV